jgi:inhibitor of cysteine peptidase
MKKSLVLVLLVVFLGFTAFALVNNEELLKFSYQINSENKVDVSYQNGDFEIIKLIPDDILTVYLPSNPTTGYEWLLEEELHARYAQLISNTYEATQTNVMGAGGTSVWTFKALNEGIVTAELNYLRSWEKDIAPVYSLMLQLQIKK